MADDTDDLDALLAPPPAAGSPELRAALFRRTQRTLTTRRWARRAGRLAAVAAVFAGGIGVGLWQARRTPEVTIVRVPESRTEVVMVPVLVPLSPASAEASAEASAPEPARTARGLELDAEQADGPRAAALYRQAGDAYLSAEADYANAARCYRLFLTRGGEPALSPEPGDSWLLTSLKNAAFKEKIHAHVDD